MYCSSMLHKAVTINLLLPFSDSDFYPIYNGSFISYLYIQALAKGLFCFHNQPSTSQINISRYFNSVFLFNYSKKAKRWEFYLLVVDECFSFTSERSWTIIAHIQEVFFDSTSSINYVTVCNTNVMRIVCDGSFFNRKSMFWNRFLVYNPILPWFISPNQKQLSTWKEMMTSLCVR